MTIRIPDKSSSGRELLKMLECSSDAGKGYAFLLEGGIWSGNERIVRGAHGPNDRNDKEDLGGGRRGKSPPGMQAWNRSDTGKATPEEEDCRDTEPLYRPGLNWFSRERKSLKQTRTSKRDPTLRAFYFSRKMARGFRSSIEGGTLEGKTSLFERASSQGQKVSGQEET